MPLQRKEKSPWFFFLAHTQLLISGKFGSQHTHFQPNAQHYKQKIAWKEFLQSIQPLQKYGMFDCQSLSSSHWLKVDERILVTVHHYAPFPASLDTLGNIPSKESIKSTSASTALTQVSHWSHYTCTANRHLRSNGERNGAQRRKVSSGRTIELLQMVKGTSWDKVMLKSEEIKPETIAIIELRLPARRH